MSHAVQQGQNRRPGPHGRGEGIHGRGEVVGFAAQQNEIERPLDALRQDRRRRLDYDAPDGAFDDEAVLCEFGCNGQRDTSWRHGLSAGKTCRLERILSACGELNITACVSAAARIETQTTFTDGVLVEVEAFLQ